MSKKPFCDNDPNPSFVTLDHLSGVKNRKDLYIASEMGLKEAFQGLTGDEDMSVKEMATRVALAMEKVKISPYQS